MQGWFNSTNCQERKDSLTRNRGVDLEIFGFKQRMLHTLGRKLLFESVLSIKHMDTPSNSRNYKPREHAECAITMAFLLAGKRCSFCLVL